MSAVYDNNSQITTGYCTNATLLGRCFSSGLCLRYNHICVTVEGKTQEQVEAEDAEEEEEAKNIQKRLAANLSEEDYDLNLLQVFTVYCNCSLVGLSPARQCFCTRQTILALESFGYYVLRGCVEIGRAHV